MRNSIRLFVASIVFATLILCFQNCGQFKKASFAQNSSFSSNNPFPNGGDSSANLGENTSGPAPEISSWDGYIPSAQVSSDCKNDSRYNVCLVLKDPVTSNNMTALMPALTPTTATPEQEIRVFKMGIKIPTGAFANAHFKLKVNTSASSLPVINSQGNFKFTYRNDSNHNISQINSFYWLNRQRQFMLDRTNKYYLSNTSASVYAFDSNIVDNAYYNMFDNSLNIGSRRYTSSAIGDLGLDIGVIAHEAGHGNLSMASNQSMIVGGETIVMGGNIFCKTKNGCFGAIHEGQGDVHSFILFPNQSPGLGMYYTNSATGMRNPANIKKNNSTATSLFNRQQGEIHDMGEAYASLWFEVWSKAKLAGTEKNIEILFSEHLATLSNRDTFSTAYTSIAALAEQLFPATSSKVIADFRIEFVRLDIDIP